MAPGDGLEEVADVVAEIDAGDDTADEQVAYAVEDGNPFGALPPRPLGELVDLVGCLTAEQLGEVVLVGADQVDGQHGCGLGDAERAVLD